MVSYNAIKIAIIGPPITGNLRDTNIVIPLHKKS